MTDNVTPLKRKKYELLANPEHYPISNCVFGIRGISQAFQTKYDSDLPPIAIPPKLRESEVMRGPRSSVHDVSEFLTAVRPNGPCIAGATGR